MIWLSLPAFAASAYWAIAIYAALKKRNEPKPAHWFTPPISILKPIRGRDEHFYEAILSHTRQNYPEYEIIFGVRDPQDESLQDIERLKQAAPHISIRIVTEAPETANGKAGMLIALARAARYPTLLVNDSDIQVEPDYLATVAQPLSDPRTGIVTCLYRARGGSFPARFEALGITTEFVPSLLVARTVGVVEFALGSTMLFRAEQLRQIGGFEAISNYLADDYQLGARISKTGHKVVLAACPVETNLGPGTWRDVWKHQVRWARTVRVSKGTGYAGSLITHATLWSLVALAAGAWPIALFCMALRYAGAFIAALVVEDHGINYFLIPARDLFGTAVWAAGLLGNTVEWRGQKLKLRSDGQIEPV